MTNNNIKRPFEQLPKAYKEYKEQEYPQFIRGIQNKIFLNEEMMIRRETIPKLFLLYEENLNLPDMDLDELKLVFPYFFDRIMRNRFYYFPQSHKLTETFTAEQMNHLIALSQTKRIPLILGREYEMNEFYSFGNKRQRIQNSFEQIFSQTESEILEQYMPLILQSGIFPGAEDKLSDISDLSSLFEIFYYYDHVRFDLIYCLYWYTIDETTRKHFHKTIYSGKTIGVEWEIFKFLQVRFTEWENRTGLTQEEQSVMDVLDIVMKNHAFTENDVKCVAHLFDGDQKCAEAFLAKQIENDGTLVLEKKILLKLIHIASNTILDRKENGKRLIQFMDLEAKGLEQLKSKEPYWYSRYLGETETFIKDIDGIRVCLTLKYIDAETSHLIDLMVTGMEQGLRITFDAKVDSYHPVIKYEDICKKNKFQEYSRLIIEGEKRIEIGIPHIISIEKQAFRKLKVEELIIKDSIEDICEKAFESQNSLKVVNVGGVVKNIGTKAFANCSNLKEVLLGNSIHWISSQAFHDCISLEEIIIPSSVEEMGADVFAGCENLKKASIQNENLLHRYNGYFGRCTQLDSILGPDGTDYLNLDTGSLMEDGTIFQKNCLFWEKIIRSKVKKLYFLQEEQFARDVIYDDESPHLCCDTLEEVQILEGTISLGNEFCFCPNLRKIILPESLESLAYNVFENQKDLKEVVLPKYATVYTFSWDRWSRFEGDLNIFKKLVIPEDHCCYKKIDSIVYKDNRLCWASDELSGKIVIPEGIERINERSFYNCKKITELVLPKTLKVIEYGAFFGCTSLKKIVIQGEEVLIDSMEPDPEVYSYGWSSGTIWQAKYDILDRHVADNIIMDPAKPVAHTKQEKKKDAKKKEERLSYRPFADVKQLFSKQE